MRIDRVARRLAFAAMSAVLVVSCGGDVARRPQHDGPNVLWIVWDTVRADRLSVYGYDKPTTPFLERWAETSRVFDDCISPAASTVPSHASMFTGLLPTEHGAYHTSRKLDTRHTTIAELFHDAGYRTYLFAANPHIQQKQNFDQGFDAHEHPWSDDLREEAVRIVRAKIDPDDRSSHLPGKIDSGEVGPWNIKAAGELAQTALVAWLETTDADRPYFAFLNYMEAHIPYIPPRAQREQMLAPEQIPASYEIDNSPLPRWAYNFGLHEFDAEQLEIIGAVYDATLLELDGLLERLLADLESRGWLDNTIVVLASDHGEHLGEHHLLDHQYSMYDPVLRVPLIVHYPQAFAAGREAGPVMNFDLFPTLLELAAVDPPAGLASKAVSLLAPDDDRLRLAEYPQPFGPAIESIHRGVDPDWDATPWLRRMRALFHGPHKLICATDGRHELYDRTADPTEARNLYTVESDLAIELMDDLLGLSATLFDPGFHEETPPTHTAEELRMLEALGYVGTGGDATDLETPPSDLCGY